MHTLKNVGGLYLALMAVFLLASVTMGGGFNPVTLLLSPAVVASIFLITGLSELDPKA